MSEKDSSHIPRELSNEEKAARIAIFKSKSEFVNSTRNDPEKLKQLEACLSQLVVEARETSRNRLLGLSVEQHILNLITHHGGVNPFAPIMDVLFDDNKNPTNRVRLATDLFEKAVEFAARPTLLSKFNYYDTFTPFSGMVYLDEGRTSHIGGGKIGSGGGLLRKF